MSLNSIHHAASSLKHRTKASLKKVLDAPGYFCAPGSFSSRWSSATTRGSDPIQIGNNPSAPSAKFHELGSGSGIASDEDNSTDSSEEEDGYVTASENISNMEDSESENLSEGGHRTENGHGDYVRHSGSGRGKYQLGSEASAIQVEARHPTPPQLYELRISVAYFEECLKEVDDATLMRFLIARNMDVAKASDMFIKDWTWRKEIAPLGYIPEDSVPRQLEAEKAFLQGLDRRGRPLIVVMGCKHFAKGRDMDEFRRFCFYCIEKVIANMPRGMEKFVSIFDLGGTGYKNLDTSATMMLAELLEAHYPERMSQLFVVHFPPMLQGIYKLIESVIDGNTRKKIMFVADGEMEMVLKREIGEECLPKVHGGKADLIPIQYASINGDHFPCQAVCCR